jgi:cytidyltransferase-like protein
MRKTIGIICEFNPFHNGHLYLINRAKSEARNVVVLMSGNFVQRGEPAMFDKYVRAKTALISGADLVLELPVVYASASAEIFASAATAILERSGIIEAVLFGSESGDLTRLNKAASALAAESPDFKNALKQNLARGLSFGAARSAAVSDAFGDFSNLLKEPNNILAVEYLKSIIRQNLKITPLTIKREPGVTAAETRAAILKGAYINMPENCAEILKKNAYCLYDDFSAALHCAIKTRDDFSGVLDVSEGLENRILKAAAENYLVSDIAAAAKTKRYAFSRIQRAILHILLNINKSDVTEPEYIRVLGFRKEKSGLLKELTDKSRLPVIINLKNSKAPKIFEKELKASDVYYTTLKAKTGAAIKKNAELSMELAFV